jgi:hypothetical protein
LGSVLVFTAQFQAGLHPGHVNLIEPLGALLLAACGGGLIVATLARVVPRVRRAVRARVAAKRRLRDAANAELRARAMMDELCPHGWHAQITLSGASEEPGPSRQRQRRDRVAVDWTAFEDQSSGAAVVRRVSAATISEALDAMVADRRTDETLEGIEEAALGDGALWPDV